LLLGISAQNGHKAIVEQLLQRRRRQLAEQLPARCRLGYAAGNGHAAVVKLFLATGQVDADSKDSYGWTPLAYAAANGHIAILKLLVKVDAKMEVKDKLEQTPLGRAAVNGTRVAPPVSTWIQLFPPRCCPCHTTLSDTLVVASRDIQACFEQNSTCC
jgi:ankyrin repeat protein